MTEAIFSTTVERVRDLLIQEASFLSGVRNQVQEIQAELERMQSFLKDADRRSYRDERVRNWIKSIRKLAYRTEDVLEEYAVKVESRKGQGIKRTLKRYACMLNEWGNIHKLGSEIVNIKNEISSLTASLRTYGISSLDNEDESSNAASRNLLRKTFAHEIEENFVGMQSDFARIVSLLTDTDKSHRIVSIYGMGGSGKTTLAKQVYNDKAVQKQFGSFAWVTLSQKFDPEKVLKEILRQINRDKYGIQSMSYEELVEELHTFQRDKKSLVVLDDIWKTEDWNVLGHAFPATSVSCKVLLTTRIQAVAELGFPHKLNLFSEEEGWQLLKKKALSVRNGTDPNLEAKQQKLGKEMVRKCGYLPLAISVIGGTLSKKDTLEDWEMVHKDIDSYLMSGEGVEDDYRVIQILSLSYEDLPYQLKPCLLYLACYPEDEEIDTKQLYWIWIAEGMILSKDKRGNETLMDVAERYMTTLESRSLVQRKWDEETLSLFKPCRIHDLTRDLCIRKAKEEDFVKVIDMRESKQPKHDLDSLGGNAYRLAIYGSEVDDDDVYEKILQEANRGTRAYFLRHLWFYEPVTQGLSKDLGSLQFLKVVRFEGLDFSNTKVLHKVMGKLIHLRYLSFEDCKLDKVPSSIAKLTYLQTFYLSSTSAVTIPNVFWKLRRLIHFVVDGYECSSKLRLDFSSGLETLICSMFWSQLRDEALSTLTNLRVFFSYVNDNDSLSSIIDCIKRKWCNIRNVSLFMAQGCEFISTVDGQLLLHELFLCRTIKKLTFLGTRIRILPRYELGMLASSDLVFLYLSANGIEEDPMPTLEKLPKLKWLMLVNSSFAGEELICSSTGFPNLQKVELRKLYNLNKWRIDDGAMPNLSHVAIEECNKLKMIPDGMIFLKVLREVVVLGMPKEFNDRIRVVNGEEGADFYKIHHVPLISILYELNGVHEDSTSSHEE